MKPHKIIAVLCLFLTFSTAQAQLLKKLGKAAEKAAARTVERRIEKETEKKTDAGLDSIFDKKKDRKKKKRDRRKKNKDKNDSSPIIGNAPQPDSPSYDVARASDFTPGNIIIFEDSFTAENQGDFPARWDTNGSGEVALVNGEKWLRLGGNSKYLPMLDETLPENYTVEFDLLTQGLDNKTSSQAMFTLLLEDNTGFQKAKNWCMVEISPCQFIESQGVVEKVENGKRILRNKIGKDYRDDINGKSHISIAVNKTRLRVWMNDNKLVDVPRLVPTAANVFKMHTRSLRDAAGVDELYIANFKIGKAGEDNRSKLITEGRLSTSDILFESGSDVLKDSSFGIIRELVQVLEENPDVNIKIIGHTDSDGTDEGNITLSRKRAEAVKKSMTLQYGIAATRIITDGMGENQPVAPNNTASGKAQNRRVEFVKI